MIVVIANGTSRSVFDINLLKNHTTYGCNELYKEYSPTHLVCKEGPMIWDICRDGYSKENKCHFKVFDRFPALQYEMLLMAFPSNGKVLETQPRTNEFVMFGTGKTSVIYWVDPNEPTQKLEWWGDDENDSYTSETAAMRLACLNHPEDKIYCIGYDYYLNRTADNIILSSKDIPTEEFDSTELFKQHKRIEEEFNNNIYHVGKHLNYVQFENLLNK
tara:strand:+ start:75 stop:725 length:651 start_codon:yes stop_codon:yes gene_type:complete